MVFLRWLLLNPSRLVATAGVAAIGILTVRLELALHQARVNRLAYLNIEAHADTTRLLYEDQGRQLRAVTRLAEQRKVDGDARLQERDREVTARADLQLQVDSLHRLVERPSIDSADVRISTFDSDSAEGSPSPLHIRATVRLPQPPAPASWDVASHLDPASLTLELACDRDRARADVVGPTWLRVQLDRIQQSADVCNPPGPSRSSSWIRRHVAPGLALGYGVIWNERLRGGLGAMIGLTVH